MKRALLELCDATAGIIRGAGAAALLIALCISRMPAPFVESVVHHAVTP